MVVKDYNYYLLRSDRLSRVGGGVCALVAKDFRHIRLDLSTNDQLLFSESRCELICFDRIFPGIKYRIIRVYRPPNNSYENKTELIHATISLSKLLNNLYHAHATTLILGDFNLPNIDWCDNIAKDDDVHNLLLNCFLDLGLTQFVHAPTRLNCNGVSNILDIILCNDPLAVDFICTKGPFSTSDHCAIDFSMHLSHHGAPYTSKPCSLSGQGSHNRSSQTSITLPIYQWSAALWSQFKNFIWPIIEMHVPKKLVQNNAKYRPRQYPKNIRKLLSRKAAIWRRLGAVNTPDLKEKYRKIALECKQAILNFDIQRENNILEANNLGAFYKFVNKKLSSCRGIAPLYDPSGNLIVSDIDKACLLNEYFQSVFTLDSNKLPDFPKRLPPTLPGICDVSITPTIVKQVLHKLKINPAAGPGGIPPIFYNKTELSVNFPLSLFYFVVSLSFAPYHPSGNSP